MELVSPWNYLERPAVNLFARGRGGIELRHAAVASRLAGRWDLRVRSSENAAGAPDGLPMLRIVLRRRHEEVAEFRPRLLTAVRSHDKSLAPSEFCVGSWLVTQRTRWVTEPTRERHRGSSAETSRCLPAVRLRLDCRLRFRPRHPSGVCAATRSRKAAATSLETERLPASARRRTSAASSGATCAVRLSTPVCAFRSRQSCPAYRLVPSSWSPMLLRGRTRLQPSPEVQGLGVRRRRRARCPALLLVDCLRSDLVAELVERPVDNAARDLQRVSDLGRRVPERDRESDPP